MKICRWLKDGGPESHVHGFFLVEIKSLFSIVLLRFSDGTREAYHSHAFNSCSWLLRGRLDEQFYGGAGRLHRPSFWPIFTARKDFHKVYSGGTSWVLSFRGPWANQWAEYDVATQKATMLTHGRKQVDEIDFA